MLITSTTRLPRMWEPKQKPNPYPLPTEIHLKFLPTKRLPKSTAKLEDQTGHYVAVAIVPTVKIVTLSTSTRHANRLRIVGFGNGGVGGRFERWVQFGDDVDASAAEAKIVDGMLEVIVVKTGCSSL
jgi:hypothetical protein